jgi:hypothetical protein
MGGFNGGGNGRCGLAGGALGPAIVTVAIGIGLGGDVGANGSGSVDEAPSSVRSAFGARCAGWLRARWSTVAQNATVLNALAQNIAAANHDPDNTGGQSRAIRPTAWLVSSLLPGPPTGISTASQSDASSSLVGTARNVLPRMCIFLFAWRCFLLARATTSFLTVTMTVLPDARPASEHRQRPLSNLPSAPSGSAIPGRARYSTVQYARRRQGPPTYTQ